MYTYLSLSVTSFFVSNEMQKATVRSFKETPLQQFRTPSLFRRYVSNFGTLIFKA